MNSFILNALITLSGLFLPYVNASAICPVCTIAVGAGVGVSRWLGIDDGITGIWIGALTASLIGWTINWLNHKNIRFYGRKILVTIIYYGAILIPLYYTKIIGDPLNTAFGIDKLILGIIIGTFTFLFSVIWYKNLKENNNNRAYFPFQKVIMPVVILLLLSAVFYCLTK